MLRAMSQNKRVERIKKQDPSQPYRRFALSLFSLEQCLKLSNEILMETSGFNLKLEKLL